MPKPKKKIIGFSYTDRKTGKRIHKYRDEFDSLDDYLDQAERVILLAKNARTLKSYRKIKDYYPKKHAAPKGRKAKR